ncbi:MAG: discoidin domain-containing protein [Saprospiraceae bacterium]|nr:discoidin domain-containing protein [Saprospiraceae bacterium]MCF8249915.1 discoidin domain-containing protein [Saprospiraceae bacterium]MCF8279328.1 discoidin domain-containing protein [Bacteroidales bacterium]MCF8310019.1 discoidin domain-containing protein [Saprospiraceae bacterium]MCF8438919.1 discoidin domain-containing protein [Saprospiraceae bacterium]
MKNFFFIFSSLLALALLAGAGLKQQYQLPVWTPNAGYIPSFTEGATVTASSNPTDAWKVLDGDPNTHWQSGGVVPGKADGTTENVTIDFGQLRPVGQIHSRHWAGEAGTATATHLYLSTDGKSWQAIAALDPTALHTVVTVLPKEITARYLRLEHQLVRKDWNKAYIWEVKAYDRFGPYGQMPTPVEGHTTIQEILGVNGYWSFGTDEYSDQLGPDGGPYRFKPVASHLRNYHDLSWDLKSPSDPIDFDKMAKGGGTPVTEWLNWDREYKAWHEGAAMNVQASLQFYKFRPEDWKNPREDGRRYAEAFTRHFGTKKGNGLICSIEAGNEPWHYPAEVYREILLGMAEGARAGDPTIEVFPCALQAVDPLAEKYGQWKNYIGDRITEQTAKLLDGINIHCYSYVSEKNGKRRAVHPEHANSTFWEMLNAIRWRNQNMPGKKIYLSEWGWDSDGAGEDCTHDECVSEQAAANYAVRGALIAARLGIDRATWFFHANDKAPSSLYSRSGLLGSANTGFAKKKTFFALQSLVASLGDKYFYSVVREDETAWVYRFGDADGKVTHLVAWRPVDSDAANNHAAMVKVGKRKAKVAWLLDGRPLRVNELQSKTKVQDGELVLTVTDVPLVVVLE